MRIVVKYIFVSGITGDVYIDDNGDRITDYSLLDMDPESGEFRVSHQTDVFALET